MTIVSNSNSSNRSNLHSDDRITGLYVSANEDRDEEMQRPLVSGSDNHSGYLSFGDINRSEEGVGINRNISPNNREDINNDDNNTNDNNNAENDDNNENRTDRDEEDEDLDAASIEETVLGLTDRLRCLFAVLTLPILPLGTALSLLLVFLVRAAFLQDLTKKCSHPMHSFAVLSLLIFIYTPNHKAIKLYLFQYSRDRDGPVRPRSVRIYDQLYHTSCLLYVYFGFSLMATCRNDLDLGISTCEATCPNLYSITQIFVSTLELFTLVLLLPLVCLPCIYLYIIRRATNAATMLQQTVRRNRNGASDQQTENEPVFSWEIMEAMDTVKLVYNKTLGDKIQMIFLNDQSRGQKSSNDIVSDPPDGSTNTSGVESDIENNQMTENLPDTIIIDEHPEKLYDLQDVGECCICMQEFYIYDNIDELRDEIDNGNKNNTDVNDTNTIVRTKCGHIFHISCIGRWVEGNWNDSFENDNTQSRRRNRRAERKVCPLCREDLTPTKSCQEDSTPTPETSSDTVSVI